MEVVADPLNTKKKKKCTNSMQEAVLECRLPKSGTHGGDELTKSKPLTGKVTYRGVLRTA